jgi:HSP20 family protein
MIAGLADPFDALLRLQRELEGRRTSEWFEDATSGRGAYPPINVFQQGHDFVTRSRSQATSRSRMARVPASTGGSA